MCRIKIGILLLTIAFIRKCRGLEESNLLLVPPPKNNLDVTQTTPPVTLDAGNEATVIK